MKSATGAWRNSPIIWSEHRRQCGGEFLLPGRTIQFRPSFS